MYMFDITTPAILFLQKLTIITICVKSDFNLKLNYGLDKFWKGSNWYPHKTLDIWDMKELPAGIMRYGVNMWHPSGTIIKANGGLMFLVSV